MPHNIEKRTIGLNFSTSASAEVVVWAPFATTVSIDIINNYIPLQKKEYGYWETELTDVNPGEKYKIVLDGKKYPDPASLFQPDGVHGDSMAVNLKSYQWNDSQWKGILPSDLIIYELHTGTFSDSGNFEGIAEKLDYLKELGITAIEIMPVAQFPGSRNWGYDGAYPFAVHNSYGGPERLQKLVDSCHHENIAVILDVVYNHFGPEGSYIAAFGPYFTDNYKTPWGSAINFDDEWSDGVRNYYLENALMWFRDFHIDGLRLDAVHAIKDFGAKHILGEIKENTDRLNSATGKTHFLLAESDLNDVRIINPPERGGYGIDLLMCDDFHHALHGLVTGEQHSYYSDFGKMSHLVKSFKDAFVFDGIFSSHRKKTFGNSTKGHPGSKFVVFSQNHDQIGNRMNGDRLSTLVDFETLKLLAAAIFFSPYVPFIFMGEEYGETNPFMYFTSHEGEKLIQYIRDGRKKEFEYLDAQGEVPDPQSLEAFNNSKLNWNNHSEEQIKLFEFYKELIRLRKAHPVLKNTDRIDLEADIIKETNALVLLRQYLQNLIICILNFEEKPVTLELQDSKKHLLVLLDSSQENHGIKQKIGNKLTVMPKSVLLVSDVKG